MLKAGFARVDVTPPLGNPLHGYFKERISDGVLDPLYINALAVSNEEGQTSVILVTDFIGIVLEDATQFREEVAKTLDIPAQNVFVQALHQHTSLRIGIRGSRIGNLDDAEYLDIVHRKMCDVAKMAFDDMEECEMSVTFKETDEPISFVRRFRMKDGSVKTNPGCLNPDIEGPLSLADNTVRLVKFEREFKNDIALVNFSTHPDVIGGNKYSADWPGFVRTFVEKDIEGVSCIVVNGCQGDVNHIDVTKESLGKVTERRYKHSQFMARTITNTVLDIWNEAEPCEGEAISGEVRILNTPTNTKGMDRVEECKKLLDDHYSGKKPLGIAQGLGEFSRISSLYDESLFQKVPLSVLKIGDLTFVAFGGEPFTDYATFARAAAPDKFVIAMCCTNGYQGYIPSKSAFDEGGYEAGSSKFTPAVSELLFDNIKEMIK